MHRVAVVRVEHGGRVGKSGGTADGGDGGRDFLRCDPGRAELEGDLVVADVDPRIAPAGIVGGMAFGIFRRPAERHRLRVEIRPPDVAAILSDTADDDAAIVDRDGVLADIDDRESRVPLPKRVAAQHVRADQIVQRKIVWQATPPSAVFRQLS